ncbi:MAG: hypothetical protein ACYCW6_14110 [Candidatus Xenobia bacterium]
MKSHHKSFLALLAAFAFVLIFSGLACAQMGGGNGTSGSNSSGTYSGSSDRGAATATVSPGVNGSTAPNATTPMSTDTGGAAGNNPNTTTHNQGAAPGTATGTGGTSTPGSNGVGWWILGIIVVIATIWAIAASARRPTVTPTRP